MMDLPLNIWLLFEHAARHFGDTELVTRELTSGTEHRTTYTEFSGRAQQLMHALDDLGLEPGATVATLQWNHYRHLECYFGIPCSGRVMHTLNMRLSADELSYIIGHAGDRAIIVDADLLPVLEKIGDLPDSVEHLIVIGDHAPSSALPAMVGYEDLLADQPTVYPRRDIPENAALGLCYTSGTTGRPKGAVYTHRSTFLHSQAVTSGAAFSFGPQDCVMPVVPMFHANAWGVPFAATAVGAKQVFAPGAMDPAAMVKLFHDEGITVSAGVPTIWLSMADEIAKQGRPPKLRHVLCGGSQPPLALIKRYQQEFDIPIVQAWGMTETSPLASVAWPKAHMLDWGDDRLDDVVRRQAGIPLPGVDVSIRDADGNEAAWDGEAMGDLYVRGPWVVDSYLHGDGAENFTGDGWFRTGDVAIGSPDGYFVIADRTKDLIKSGGEWISSVDMEAAIMAMDDVIEAAVIAVPDPKWQERPIACVVPKPGTSVTLEAVHSHLASRGFAKWQLPDRVEIIDEVPKTGVGKFDKKVLRSRFQ
jgi:fatty-acyl-CoA synthase